MDSFRQDLIGDQLFYQLLIYFNTLIYLPFVRMANKKLDNFK